MRNLALEGALNEEFKNRIFSCALFFLQDFIVDFFEFFSCCISAKDIGTFKNIIRTSIIHTLIFKFYINNEKFSLFIKRENITNVK